MKKWTYLLCTVMLVGFTSNAGATKLSLGLIGGVNFADLTDVDETSVRTGFSGGGFVEADFSPKYGARLEVLYTQKGVERNANPEFGDSSSTLKLDYVEFPLLFVANLTQSETTGFALVVGPSFGYNISAEDVADAGPTIDVADNVEPLDVDLVLAFEFEHIRSSLSMFVDVRFSIGLVPVFENAPSAYEDIKNQDLLLLLGLKFPLGGGE